MTDPAFLFYVGDWLGGTLTFSRLHKGAYMDLLMVQFNQGQMSLEDIKAVLGSDFELVWGKLESKFTTDENGLFYNRRLRIEIERRKHYTQSRRDNLASKKETKEEEPIEEAKTEPTPEVKTWRNDFETYKSQLREVYKKLTEDDNYIKIQEKFHPNVDIKVTLNKACVNYWATEAGWKNKKSKKSKNIDWKSTLTNAIDNNKVYKPKDKQEQTQQTVYKGNFLKNTVQAIKVDSDY